ncbi:MAG: tetratricopeptide repeat protein [Terriglobales bacterium]
MSQRPTLDASSFETLLFAAWVLQCQHDKEMRDRKPASADTHVSSLGEAGEVKVGQRTALLKDMQSGRSKEGAPPSSPSWLAVRKQWEVWTATVGHSAWRESQVLQRAQFWLSGTASPGFLGAQSSLLGAAKASGQIREATTQRLLPGLLKEALSRNLRHGPSQSNVAQFSRNRLEAFARYRVRVRIRLSPRRTLEAASAALSVLLIVVGFTIFQSRHHGDFQVVAATSGNDHLYESGIRKADLSNLTPPLRASHGQVTDRAALFAIGGLSRYEIPALRRQAYFGDDSAALIMGMLYETGRYVPQSCSRAAEWVQRSADWGNAAAQFNLGLRYRDGDGVPANEDEAKTWLRKAADNKYANARLALEALTSHETGSTYAP